MTLYVTQMNYKIEGGFDFYSAILEDEDDLEAELCLLSNMPLDSTCVKLPCNHSFNYLNLYNEVIAQKSSQRSNIEENKLRFTQFRCPYCRQIYSKLLPYLEIEGVKKINGVNSTQVASTLNVFPCTWTIEKGKRSGQICGKHSFHPEINKLCRIHCAVADRRSNVCVKVQNTCQAVIKSGSRKGEFCGCKCIDKFCKRHSKLKEINS